VGDVQLGVLDEDGHHRGDGLSAGLGGTLFERGVGQEEKLLEKLLRVGGSPVSL
jgi:hypothetical protein